MLSPENHFRRVAATATVRGRLVRRRASAQADVLQASEYEGGRRLAALLDAVARDRLDEDEEAQLARVEAGRWRILRSRDSIAGRDGRAESVARVCAQASQPPAGARVLFHAAASWRPRSVLEMGTCVGVSAAYQASAQLLSSGGRLVGLEAYDGRAERARSLWAECGLAEVEVRVGRFADTLPKALVDGPFDYVFVDGNHSAASTRSYVEAVSTVADPGALLVLDDITYSDGMRAAWHDVRHRPDVVASADLGKIGLAVLR